ncbi:MAG: anthranilate synthase component I [Pseudomonadota bacterium]
MNYEQMTAWANDGYNLAPITVKALADLDTPLSVYSKLANKPYSFLFESVEGGEKWGRYSIIGLPSSRRIEVRANQVRVFDGSREIESQSSEDPLDFVAKYQARFRVAPQPDLERFSGGLVGYFGYDTVRFVERSLADSMPPDTLGLPDIVLMQCDDFVVFDNLRGEMLFVSYVDPNSPEEIATATQRIERSIEEVNKPYRLPPPPQDSSTTIKFKSEFGETEFLEAVEKIKRYIIDGDVMQVVLAQRLSAKLEVEPIHVYRALRHLNPSPYMYFIDLGDHQVVGSSPEILVRVNDSVVTTRPLAGTRHRGTTVEEDQRLEEELLSDPKEVAEHLMLIDLGRNDIGKVATTGTVKVTERMAVERYSHVMHISSTVEGSLDKKLSTLDALRSTLPVGTLSGAPKVRAMQIIDELEPSKRGVYGGAIGYLSWNANMDMAIAIRTAVIHDGTLYVQSGCGVVADSVAELEWQETINKGRAIFQALEMTHAGLAPRAG